MKKNIKQIVAIVSLIAIAVLIILFIISALFAKPNSGNTFLALFFGIVAIPLFAWIFLFCYGRFKGEHTMAEFFPENYNHLEGHSIPENPESHNFTDEEIIQAMENSKE